MKTFTRLLLITVSFSLIITGTALANPLGTNITISNGETPGQYPNILPGCVQGPEWYLEGFYLDGYNLTLVAAFNLKQGQNDPYRPGVQYDSGDLFIDSKDIPLYGLAAKNITTGNYGYNYVLHMTWDTSTPTYDVYDISQFNGSMQGQDVYFSQNNDSKPFKYEPPNGAQPIYSNISLLSYSDNFTDSSLPLLPPGSKYCAATFDLSFLSTDLGPGDEFYTHFTIGCGNANLMGKGTAPVPEPATLLLLGSGLLGLAGFRKKNK
jgi:hypothetical protein